VLIGVAKILKQSIRDYDVAARFGGEEFAILLPETTIQQAYERVESIRETIESTQFTIPTSASPIRATMSFGIACRENLSQTTDEIIHNADAALYRSKLNGRNRAYAYTRDGYMNYRTRALEKTAFEEAAKIVHPLPDGACPSEQASV
jgi:diguanylate cyclase (GGDEF)-like protein